MNLMIGLAVENIQDIKDNAEFKKLSDQVGILYIHIRKDIFWEYSHIQIK